MEEIALTSLRSVGIGVLGKVEYNCPSKGQTATEKVDLFRLRGALKKHPFDLLRFPQQFIQRRSK